MQKHVYDSCLECIRLIHPHGDQLESIVGDVARMSCLVRFALFWHRRSLRQPLLSPGHLTFPPKLLRRGRLRLRFLRAGAGCAVATAHRLVTAPASVSDDASFKMIWRNRIFARVMSGFVMRQEVLLQAAAAARIVGYPQNGILRAATDGYSDVVLGFLITHANCVNEHDG